VAKAVFRQVKSMTMSLDSVGNLLLAKFSFQGGPDTCVMIPASIVFWMLRHLPVNQDPNLRPPATSPELRQQDWNFDTPRALSVVCNEMPGALRVTMALSVKPDLTMLMDRSNVELMRQYFAAYAKDLIDLDAA